MANEGGYAFLAQRAYLYLRERATPVDEDSLIRYLFSALPGQNSARMNVEVWRGLLPGVLDGDRFSALGNRMWALTEWQERGELVADELASLSYIVLDTETTGLRPDRDRMIELAALRYDPSRPFPAEVYSSLFNPHKRLPAFIINFTGISQSEVEDAPDFAPQADQLLAYLGNAILVGHNISFDLGFINSELRQSARPALASRRLDTLSLAVRLLPELGKPNLDNLAARLGLPVGIRHRAEADARLTHNAMQKLLGLARERGVKTLDGLLELAKPLGYAYWGKRKDKGAGSRFNPDAWAWPSDPLVRESRHTVGEAGWEQQLPTLAGAYVFRDEEGAPLYVGKAINLQRRVSGYFGRDETILRGLAGLNLRVRVVEVHEVGSGLAASLREAELIRALDPPYNTQKQERPPRPYLNVQAVKSAGVRRIQASSKAGAESFGPFANRAEVDDLLRLLRAVYPSLHPKQPPAPDHEAQLAAAVAYLRGEADPTLTRLRHRLQAATAALDYDEERTSRALLKEAVSRAESLGQRAASGLPASDEQGTALLSPAPASKLQALKSAIVVLPALDAAVAEVLIVREGRLAWRGPLPAGGREDVLTARLAELWHEAVEPAQVLESVQSSYLAGVAHGRMKAAPLDAASSLVLRWLYANPTAAIIPASEEREAVQDWLREAARRVQGVGR